MERPKLVAWLGGLALVAGAVVVLRNESAPPAPAEFGPFFDRRVEYVADTQPLHRPGDLALTALDRTSLRATWTATGGLGHGGFEVRWAGRTRLVQATEAELTDLDPNAEVAVEVRAVGPLGERSDPAVAKAVPRLVHDQAWADRLVQPIDRFDGPEALSPRRWRVFDGGEDCLGLSRPGGGRLEVTCDLLDLQSNVPLRLGVPVDDGAIGRVVVTTDGPVVSGSGDGELLVALLPEPFHDLGRLVEPYPPGSVVLTVTRHGATFGLGAGLPTTSRVVPIGGVVPPPTAGVRHRWELRVLPDAVVALRDGEALAAAPVAVPWTSARPRLAFREATGTLVDSFGTGGAPESPVPASVVPLGTGGAEATDLVLGTVPAHRLDGSGGVRVVARVARQGASVRDVPITVRFGDREAPAVFLPPFATPEPLRDAVVHADFPVPGGDAEVRVSAPEPFAVLDAHVVVADGRTATRPLPRLGDRPEPVVAVPDPTVAVVHEAGADDAGSSGGGTARVVVELDGAAREVAAVKGVEVQLDGERIAVLPTHGSAGGRHEFLVDLTDVPTGGHRVRARVLPVDDRGQARSAEQAFEIRPL